MAGETQKVWKTLLEVQSDLARMPEKEVPDCLAYIESELTPAFDDAFGHPELIVHSVGAYVTRLEEQRREVIGEKLYICTGLRLGTYVLGGPDGARQIIVEFDADGITNPPDAKDFEPFFREVSVPILAISSIKAAA